MLCLAAFGCDATVTVLGRCGTARRSAVRCMSRLGCSLRLLVALLTKICLAAFCVGVSGGARYLRGTNIGPDRRILCTHNHVYPIHRGPRPVTNHNGEHPEIAHLRLLSILLSRRVAVVRPSKKVSVSREEVKERLLPSKLGDSRLTPTVEHDHFQEASLRRFRDCQHISSSLLAPPVKWTKNQLY